MKTELIVTGDILNLRFDQQLFLCFILGLPPHWGYERLDEYFSEKKLKIKDKK